jgi:hypothetical protein
MRSEDIKVGQVLQLNMPGGPCLAFVYSIDGVRVDLLYAGGHRDGVFIKWLASISNIIC